MPEQPSSYDEMVKRAQEFRLSKSGSAGRQTAEGMVPEKDPRLSGGAAAQDHAGGGDDPAKLLLPGDMRSATTQTSVPDGVTDVTNPRATTQGTPAHATTPPVDPSFTTPTSKLAAQQILENAKAATARIKALTSRNVPQSAPAPATAAPAQQTAKSADSQANDLQFTEEFHLKLAAEILATKEGVDFVNQYLTKRAGAEVAQNLIAEATRAQQGFIAMGRHVQEMHKAAALQQLQEVAQADEILKGASAEDQQRALEFGQMHASVLAQVPPEFHWFYKQGALDAAAMNSGLAEGNPEPMIPGAEEGEMSIEQIAALLEMMVQQGELPPEAAQMLLQELMGQGGGGAPMEGAAPESDPAAAAPAEEEAPLEEGAPKEAGVARRLIPELFA